MREKRGPLAYLSPPGFESELATELGRKGIQAITLSPRLFFAENAPLDTQVAWTQNIWHAPERIAFESIAQAARELRARGRNWGVHSDSLHRRAQLIHAALPKVGKNPVKYLAENPQHPMGAFTLLDAKTMLASKSTNHPYPLGETRFAEDKDAPPSRAYLKLWELFTIYGVRPQKGELCLDLGSSPGGWTWVLAELGCNVRSVDKTELDPKVASMLGVGFVQQSAFSIDPKEHAPVDWFFSDVICYPERLWKLVERWLKAEGAKNYVCSIKFQDKTDFATLEKFAAVPGSRLVHLHHNKHELTWYLLRNK